MMREYSHDAAASALLLGIGGVGAWIVAVMSEPPLAAVVVAVIGAIGAVASAHLANSARKDVKDRIGEPNGGQDVVSMLTKILDGQTGQDARLAVHDRMFAKFDHRLNVLSASMDSIRQECHFIRAVDEDTTHKVDDIAGRVGADRSHTDHEGEAP